MIKKLIYRLDGRCPQCGMFTMLEHDQQADITPNGVWVPCQCVHCKWKTLAFFPNNYNPDDRPPLELVK